MTLPVNKLPNGIVVMKLAANQRDAAFDNLLKQIEGDAQHNHQSEAIKLRKMLN